MKRRFTLFVLLPLLCSAVAAKSDMPDTTLTMRSGGLVIFGTAYDGREVQLKVSGTSLLAKTPTGDVLLWALPDPARDIVTPLSQEAQAHATVIEEASELGWRLRDEPPSMIRAALNKVVARHPGVIDSIVPTEWETTLHLYWANQKEAEALLLCPPREGNGPTKATTESVRRSLIAFARRLIDRIDQNDLVLLASAPRLSLPPRFEAYQEPKAKESILLYIIATLEGRRAAPPRFLPKPFSDEIARRARP